ncbi:hypothetical protein MUK42_03325 [Musa troglodytarum]|nr:hypothetical protein MUK42_03325 [Musa troglodytarum]
MVAPLPPEDGSSFWCWLRESVHEAFILMLLKKLFQEQGLLTRHSMDVCRGTPLEVRRYDTLKTLGLQLPPPPQRFQVQELDFWNAESFESFYRLLEKTTGRSQVEELKRSQKKAIPWHPSSTNVGFLSWLRSDSLQKHA